MAQPPPQGMFTTGLVEVEGATACGVLTLHVSRPPPALLIAYGYAGRQAFQQAMGPPQAGYPPGRGIRLLRAIYGIPGREHDVTSMLLPSFLPGPLDLSISVTNASL